MPSGYWESEFILSPVDLTVVGAGIVGMSTALFYQRKNPTHRVRILERSPLGLGGTTRNAGFACFGSAGEWLDDVDALGSKAWAELVKQRACGLNHLVDLLGSAALELSWRGGWELFSHSPEDRALFERVMGRRETLNQTIQPVLAEALANIHPSGKDTPALLNDPHRAAALGAHGAMWLPWEGMLNAGKMTLAFHAACDRAGIQRVHGTEVNSMNPVGDAWSVDTAMGTLHSNQIAICTNGMAAGLIPGLDVRPVPNRVLVLKPHENRLPVGTYHLERGYLYMRSLDNGLVLFGGGRHWGHALTPGTDEREQQGVIRTWDEQLLAAAKTWIGECGSPVHAWTGWLGVGNDRTPIVTQSAPGLHCGARMGGMGVAIGAGIGFDLATRLTESAA